ncbi:putative short chain dehydrogenase/reductase [Hypoxylon fragiforme]|uniref:putative short chain dehydrogenase/reductase n=1 Tax=Hypoxylon fragiforme TaxID=63214 RepID=UPI0020C61E6C|nr:putative short chain dehydrogenase/reductase [Hypoxylon fragiforme]KAI2608175.1 putative short chain dehydrogenase/reductase [Hypoxylon fragiforme]
MASNKTVVLVTGGNSGIGFETVLALSSASPNLHILLGSRSLEKGQKALEEMQALSRSRPDEVALQSPISVLQLDVADRASIAAAKQEIAARFGKLDALVNNAGVMVHHTKDLEEVLRLSFEVNTFGPLFLTEALEPLLREAAATAGAGGARVIYVTSSQGSISEKHARNESDLQYRGFLVAEPYRMSKAAVNMLAACHRANFGGWGCKVLALNPGDCVSNLTGAEGLKAREKRGSQSPKLPAGAIRDLVLGKRDGDFEKNGIVEVDGGVLPW